MGGGGAITFGSKPSPGLGRANGEFPRPKTGGRIPGFRGRGANLELRDEDAPGWPGGRDIIYTAFARQRTLCGITELTVTVATRRFREMPAIAVC